MPQTSIPGLCPWTLIGDFRPPGPLFSHILNTPPLYKTSIVLSAAVDPTVVA